MKGAKVLVVDDEKEFADTLAERLDLRGFETIVALNGEDAMNIVFVDIPDVMILDLKMPGMNGLEVIEAAKRHAPEIAVIMLTGHGSIENGIESMKRGAFDCILKPVNIIELVEKINQANSRRQFVRRNNKELRQFRPFPA